MKLTSYDLEELGVIDEIVLEPIGGAHFNKEETYENTKKAIVEGLLDLSGLSRTELREDRIDKYRGFGFFQRFNYDNLGGVKR